MFIGILVHWGACGFVMGTRMQTRLGCPHSVHDVVWRHMCARLSWHVLVTSNSQSEWLMEAGVNQASGQSQYLTCVSIPFAHHNLRPSLAVLDVPDRLTLLVWPTPPLGLCTCVKLSRSAFLSSCLMLFRTVITPYVCGGAAAGATAGVSSCSGKYACVVLWHFVWLALD